MIRAKPVVSPVEPLGLKQRNRSNKLGITI